MDSPPVEIPEFEVEETPDGLRAVHRGDRDLVVTAPDHDTLARMCCAARIRRTWALA